MRQHQTLLKPWIERHPKAQGLILTALDPEKPVVIKTCNTTGVGNNCQKTEYKVDEGPWKKYTDERTTLRGNIIQVRRKNCTNGKEIIQNETYYTNCISIQAECGKFKLSGYIGSILDWEKNIFDTLEYPNECFMNFISGSDVYNTHYNDITSNVVNSKITSGTIPVVDISELKLPDIVTENMYNQAFNKCGYLTKIMDLNVDELASNCYNSMFQWCINLEYPMENLPATKLASSCYYSMFQYCKNLKKIPNITAELGAERACQQMFSYCYALKDISNFKVNINAISNGIFYNMFEHCISLEKGIDLSATTTFTDHPQTCYYGMYSYCTSLKDPGILPKTLTLKNENAGDGGVYHTDQVNGLFQNMYEYCYMLETPPKLPHFINSSIYANEDEITGIHVFESMFLNCHNLKSMPDLSDINIMGGNNICAEMCSGCSSISEIPDNYLSTFGNHLGDAMFYRMFKDCIGLKKIGKIFGDNRIFKYPGSQNSHKKTWYPTVHSTFKEMFYNCQSLEEMPTENWLTINPAKYTYSGSRAFGYMFKDCKKLKSAQGIKIYCDSTEVVYADCAFMFAGCSELTSIDITIDFYPSAVSGDYSNGEYAAFYHMFEGCTKLTTLPDRNWLVVHRPQQHVYKDTNDVSTGEYLSCYTSSDAFNNMFKDCTFIKSIHGIVYENALDHHLFYGMCENCTSLESFDIDLSNIDITYVTGKFNDVTNVQRSAYSMYKKMFYNCSKLTSVCELPMRNLGYRVIDTEGNVNSYTGGTNSGMCYQMFYGCSSIETINFCMQNIKEFNSDTSNDPGSNYGGEFYGMFEGCTSLKTTNLDLSAVEVCRGAGSLFERMFYNCKNLTTIPNFSFDASLFTKVYNSYYTYRDMFYGCDALGDKLLEIKLPAINVVYNTSSSYYGRNYERMFANVSTLDLSVVQTDVYNTPYRIPDTGTLRYGGSGYEKELSADKSYMYTTDMFSGTKGTMNGTPELYTTYYYKGPGSDSGGDSGGDSGDDSDLTDITLVNDIDIGTKTTFKAWRSCYYLVNYNSETSSYHDTYMYFVPYPHIYIKDIDYYNSIKVKCCTSYTRETSGDNVYLIPNNELTGFTFSPNTMTSTIIEDYNGWVGDDGSFGLSAPTTSRFALAYTQEISPSTKGIYTRVLSDDIIYYTLDEPNDGQDDIKNWIAANKTSETVNIIKYSEPDNYTNYSFEKTTEERYSITNGLYSDDKFYPSKFSCIVDNTIYMYPTSTCTYIKFYDTTAKVISLSLGAVFVNNSGNYWDANTIINNTRQAGYIIDTDGYANNTEYAYIEDSIGSNSITILPKSVVQDCISYFKYPKINYDIVDENTELYIACDGKIEKYSEYYKENTFIDQYNRTIFYTGYAPARYYPRYYYYAASTGEVQPGYSTELINYMSENNNSIKENSINYIGYEDSYSYQNYTYSNLSETSPHAIYMKGTDGNMYLMAQIEETDSGKVAGPVYTPYGNGYNVSFIPFGTYSRQDENKGSADHIWSLGGFVRDSSLDITATFKGVINQQAGWNLKDGYYDTANTNFKTFTSKAKIVEWDAIK